MNKSPKDSEVIATHIVMPSDTNNHNTAFGGTIMGWMDIAAATAATRHSGKPCVTASVDRIQFNKPIRVGDIVTLKARVNYTGRSSMEVGIRVSSENPMGDLGEQHCLTGYMTFVALDRITGTTPVEVPRLEIASQEDKRRWDEAKERRETRLQERTREKANKDLADS